MEAFGRTVHSQDVDALNISMVDFRQESPRSRQMRKERARTRKQRSKDSKAMHWLTDHHGVVEKSLDALFGPEFVKPKPFRDL
jgi:hypothetical protein